MLPLALGRPVPCELAGRSCLVAPYRLCDLADLEVWAARLVGTIPQGLRAAVTTPDQPTRRAELRRLYELALAGGIAFGSPDVNAQLDTHAGRTEQLWLTLRTRDPRGGWLRRTRRAWCKQLGRDMDRDDWAAWRDVAWQAYPQDAAMRAIDTEIGVIWPTPQPRSGEDLKRHWEGSIYAVMKATGLSFGEIGRLTLYQWDILRSCGEPQKVSSVEPEENPDGIDPDDYDREVLEKRSAFFEETDGDHLGADCR